MKKMKKILSVVLTIAMLMSMIVLPVSAEGTMETISVGETKNVVLEPNSETKFQFTAPETGCYILTTTTRRNFGYHFWDVADTVAVGVGHWNSYDDSLHGPVMQTEAGKVYEITIMDHEGNGFAGDFTLVKAHNFNSLELDRTQIVEYMENDHTWLGVKPSNDFVFEPLSWSSSNSDVAVIVQPNGTSTMIGFNGVGTTIITASTASGLTATCEVTIKEMESVSVGENFVTIPAEGSTDINFTAPESGNYLFYMPSGVWNIGFDAWTFDGEMGVKSSEWEHVSGTYHGRTFEMTAGTVYKIRMYNWQPVEQSFPLNVVKTVPYETIEFPNAQICYVGNQIYLRLSGTPDFATGSVTWTNSNPSAAEVTWSDNAGVSLTGLSAGTTTITATTENGLTATCEVTVKNMETIAVGETKPISLVPGENLRFEFTPAESGRYIAYRHSSDNFGMEFMRASGEWVPATQWFDKDMSFWGNAADMTAGETYIISVYNWNDRDTVNSALNLVKAEPVDSISFEKDNYTFYVGGSQDIHLSIEPYFGCEEVVYTSSNPAVAEIDGEDSMGVRLNFNEIGTSVITATTESGKTASCTVTVAEMATLKEDSINFVNIPTNSSVEFSFTPTQSGSYVFYLPNGIWNVGCNFHEMDTGMWIDSNDWEHAYNQYHGWAVELTAGKTYRVGVSNWQAADMHDLELGVIKGTTFESIEIANAQTVYVGAETYLRIIGSPDFAAEPVEWTISNPDVVEVMYSSGMSITLRGLAVGTTTLTATTASGLSTSCELRVAEVDTIELGETITMEIPYQDQVRVEFTPSEDGVYLFYYPSGNYLDFNCYRKSSDGWRENLQWNNADKTLSGCGFELSANTTYVLQISNWNNQDGVTVDMTSVKAVDYSSIKFKRSNYVGYVGTYVSLELIASPEFSCEPVEWTSSNEAVAVPEYVYGASADLMILSAGTTTITATTASGKTATCTVTTKDPVEIKQNKSQSITVEGEGTGAFKFTPVANGTYSFVVENLEDGFGFSVLDGDGMWMEGEWWFNGRNGGDFKMNAGETYLIMVYNNLKSERTINCIIGERVKATGIELPEQGYNLYPGVTFFWSASFAPALANEEKITWTSSNENVFKFLKTHEYEGGYVGHEFKAVSAGTATLTATSASGLKASAKVTVSKPGKIDLGEHTAKIRKWDLVMYEFTAPEAGTYVIYDEDPDSLVGWYPGEDKEVVVEPYEDGDKMGMKITLAAGETIWPVVQNDTDEEKTFTFTIEQGVHEHELVLVKAKDATYVEPGNIEHYACSCGKLYADAEGKTELSEEDVVIPQKVLAGTTFEEGVQQTITFESGETKVYNFTATENGEYVLGYRSNDYLVVDVETADGEYVEISNGGSRGDANYYYVYMTTGTSYIFKIHPAEEKGASCEIAFGQERKATAINFGKSNVTAHPYESITLTWDFGHILAMSEEVTLTSSNPAVVDYVENKDEGLMELKAFTTGTAVITATTESGLKDTCTITVQTPKAIGLGEHTTPALERMESISYSFTPEVSGEYDLYLTSEMDFRLSWSSLEMSEREFWANDDYVGFRAYLEAGETYTIWVQNFYMPETKAFTFWLEEAPHEHALTLVPEKAPTFAEDGMKAHYACECGTLFADEAGTTIVEAADLLIPKLIQVEDGKAEVPKEAIDEAIQEVEQGGEVSIPVADAGAGSEEEVKSAALPVESLTQITEKEATLTVEMPAATVTMDTAALAAVVEKAGENASVTLEVQEVAKEDLTETQMAAIEQLDQNLVTTISAELLVNNQAIASEADGGFGGGKVTVKIPVKLSSKDFQVVYIADDGSTTVIENATYADGVLTLELEHFSTYAIVQDTMLGDTNGDGSITILDLMRLANFFAGNAEINEGNADVNSDGSVTILDLMRLANYFAGNATLG